MAYFSNGSEGDKFTVQCAQCKYGNEPCPIAGVQMRYNYDACNVKTARTILDELISDSGECSMFKTFEKDLRVRTFEEANSGYSLVEHHEDGTETVIIKDMNLI